MSTVSATPGGGWSARPALHRLLVSHPTRHPEGRLLPELARGERVLTQAVSAIAGGAVIGTNRALHLRSGNSAWRRIDWVDVSSAAWSPAAAETVLRFWPGDGGAPTGLRVPTDRGFAAFAAERVLSTQVMCRRVQLTPAVAATVTALRGSGDDTVTWRVRLDGTSDSDDPRVRIAAEQTLAELRALAGC